MKKIIITAFAFVITVSFCACGPTPEEIAQTEWLVETIEEQERLEKQLDDTLAESEQMMDNLDQEIEQILGMSLDEAMGEEEPETEEAEAFEPATEEADTAEEGEPAADTPFWSVKIGDLDVMSDGLAKEFKTNSIKIEGTEYEGYRIGDVLEIANVGSVSEVRALFKDGTSASINIAELFENDTLLIFKIGSEYLEQPVLYFSGTLYEKAVLELVIT